MPKTEKGHGIGVNVQEILQLLLSVVFFDWYW